MDWWQPTTSKCLRPESEEPIAGVAFILQISDPDSHSTIFKLEFHNTTVQIDMQFQLWNRNYSTPDWCAHLLKWTQKENKFALVSTSTCEPAVQIQIHKCRGHRSRRKFGKPEKQQLWYWTSFYSNSHNENTTKRQNRRTFKKAAESGDTQYRTCPLISSHKLSYRK